MRRLQTQSVYKLTNFCYKEHWHHLQVYTFMKKIFRRIKIKHKII